MRKHLLLFSVLSLGLSVSAQNVKVLKNTSAQLKKITALKAHVKDNALSINAPYATPSTKPLDKGTGRHRAGQTTYDLQTNNCVPTRIVNLGNGKAAMTYTYSKSVGALTFPDRGMAYNYFDGTSMQHPDDLDGSNRVTGVRTGFGGIAKGPNNNELVYGHVVDNKIRISLNGTSGSNTFGTQKDVDGTFDLLWPRLATSGNNIHLIGITEPTGGDFTGTIYKGLNGALLYFRSTDGGLTWDKDSIQLPGLDSIRIPKFNATTPAGFGGDNYQIVAKGNTVAVAVQSNYTLDPIHIIKSTDNGETWTRKVALGATRGDSIYNAEGAISDVTGDGIADTVDVAVGSFDIALDNANMVHLVSATRRVIDTARSITDSFFIGFTFAPNLCYWNESMDGQPGRGYKVIANALLDFDGDEAWGGSVASFHPYRPADSTAMCIFPSIAIDPSNKVFVTFSMPREDDKNDDEKMFYHLFATFSQDGGATWRNEGQVIDLTPMGSESVYGSLAKDVDNYLHLVYQEDLLSGSRMESSATPRPSDINDIMYMQYTVADLLQGITTGIKETTTEVLNVYPNPSNGLTYVSFNLKNNAQVDVQVLDLTGKTVQISSTQNLTTGANKLTVNTSNLTSGIYFIHTTINGVKYTNKLIVN